MEETLSQIGSYGGLIILAGLFVWTYFQDKTKEQKHNEENNKMLERIDKSNENIVRSNENIARSIDAINSTTQVLKEYIIKHDERAKKIDDNVNKLLEKEN